MEKSIGINPNQKHSRQQGNFSHKFRSLTILRRKYTHSINMLQNITKKYFTQKQHWLNFITKKGLDSIELLNLKCNIYPFIMAPVFLINDCSSRSK